MVRDCVDTRRTPHRNETLKRRLGSEARGNVVTRRKKITIVLAATALALVGCLVCVAARRVASMLDRLQRVSAGMTYAEVVAILGTPAPVVEELAGLEIRGPGIGAPWLAVWVDRRGVAFVRFDHDDKSSSRPSRANCREPFCTAC